MRTALSRFSPFSQDQTPIWNEFCYNCNFSLRAKPCPARGQSLSVIREQKEPQSHGPALAKDVSGGETKLLSDAELPPWCVWKKMQKSLLFLHHATPPPCICCRVIRSRWEVNSFCFLSLSLLLLQFASIFISCLLLFQTEVNWPRERIEGYLEIPELKTRSLAPLHHHQGLLSIWESNSWPCSRWGVFIAETVPGVLSCLLPTTGKQRFAPWKEFQWLQSPLDQHFVSLPNNFHFLMYKMSNFCSRFPSLNPGENSMLLSDQFLPIKSRPCFHFWPHHHFAGWPPLPSPPLTQG